MKSTNKFISTSSVLLLILSLPVAADQEILDDLIVEGSLCAGQGCADGEIFDFDTIKLKSPTPQIQFVDTSSTASFPSADWTMGVEDSLSDISVFIVKDANANAPVLQLSASSGGGVALGADAELEDGAVSVGATGTERRIIHVADAIYDTDAVNLGQVQPQLDALQVEIGAINVRLDDLLNKLNNL